jgi:hypothetical protein
VKQYLPPTETELADLLWAASPSIETTAELKEWIATLQQLDSKTLEHLFAFSYMAAQSARFICDRFWTWEVDRPQPDLERLDEELAELADISRVAGASVVIAAVARARIVVASSYQKDIAKAISIAEDVIQLLNALQVEFLLSFSVAMGCADAGQPEQARQWFTRAHCCPGKIA